jgi:predicted TIM-barrel fold metal-dependent hydrolase
MAISEPMPSAESTGGVAGAALLISSDGHAIANMEDYRPYLPSGMHEDFDAFCGVYREHGGRNSDPDQLAGLTDPDVVEKWTRETVERGYLDGISDPDARIREQDRQGCSGEVLHPDFGLPFEMGSSRLRALFPQERTLEQLDAAHKAHNRWLADFMSVAPERFAGLAVVTFDDVDSAVKEIRWAKEAGFKGVMLPHFDEAAPLYDPRFEPIWSTAEDLGMPVNSHGGLSSISRRMVTATPSVPHPSSAFGLRYPQLFFHCHQILTHFIFGGVLERHPGLRLVLTEQGSYWTLGALQAMDYTYDGSYAKRDVREVLHHKPSDYFARQVMLGSSIFSLSEIEARREIGIDKMMLGFDYPHHEGAWSAGPGLVAYLRATLGVAGVPAGEARQLLSGNISRTWGFDLDALAPVAGRVGPSMEEILTPAEAEYYPRGDVHKPLALTH